MRSHLIVLIILFSFPTVTLAATLDVPREGDRLSGIGVIHGWKCYPQDITVSIDGGNPIPARAPYPRADTGGHCDNAGWNGFFTVVNWGVFGDGLHTVTAFENGVPFARRTVTVTTLGEEFVTGIEKRVIIPDFPAPGEQVEVEWNTGTQHFEILQVFSRHTPPSGDGSLIDDGHTTEVTCFLVAGQTCYLRPDQPCDYCIDEHGQPVPEGAQAPDYTEQVPTDSDDSDDSDDFAPEETESECLTFERPETVISPFDCLVEFEDTEVPIPASPLTQTGLYVRNTCDTAITVLKWCTRPGERHPRKGYICQQPVYKPPRNGREVRMVLGPYQRKSTQYPFGIGYCEADEFRVYATCEGNTASPHIVGEDDWYYRCFGNVARVERYPRGGE